MGYQGDMNLGDTLDFTFPTVNTSGVPTVLSGTPVIVCYKGNNTTQTTAGLTLTVDFDSLVGLNHVRVVLSDAFYVTATDYSIVITTGTVGGNSVVGYVVATFSIENRSGLRPTTKNRTLDVTATGAAGIDLANVENQGTTLALSATTIKTATDVETDTADIQTRLPAALSSGNMKCDVLAIDTDTAAAANLEAEYDGTGYKSYLRLNTAQAGTASNITLDASASATTDLYKGLICAIVSGTGVGQARLITSYNGTTKAASIAPNWDTTPDATSVFTLWPFARVDVARWVGTAVNNLVSGNVPADVVSISGDATAADNLEALLDGTGGVTLVASAITLTTPITANVTQLGGVAQSLTDLKDFADDGYDPATNKVQGVVLTDQVAGMTTAMKAEVQAEAEEALVTYGLDHLLAASVAGTDVTDNSILARLVSKSATADWDTFVNTTDALEAIRDRGDASWLTAAGFSTHSAADVWTSGTRTLTAATNITNTGGTTVAQTGDNFARLGAPTGASIAADIATKPSAAQVNAEVVDALNVDTYAEPGQEVPPATASIVKKIGYLFKMLRNKKTQTATERKLFADDGTTVDQKATDSDDATTFTKGELGTGP